MPGMRGDNYNSYPDYGPKRDQQVTFILTAILMSTDTWKAIPYPIPESSQAIFGVFYVHGYIKIKDILVGTSHLYLAGEKYLNPDHYLDSDTDNDQPWSQGLDVDTVRWVNSIASTGSSWAYALLGIFGSSHASTFNMVFCDGAVHSISYDITPIAHRALGNRKGKYPDPSKPGSWIILPTVDGSQYQLKKLGIVGSILVGAASAYNMPPIMHCNHPPGMPVKPGCWFLNKF